MAENKRTLSSSEIDSTDRRDSERPTLETIGLTFDKRLDLAVAIAIVLLGIYIVIATGDIRKGSMPDPITARGLPYITGALLVIGGILVAVRQLLNWSKLPGNMIPEEGQEDEKGYPVSWVRCFVIILLSFLWEWLLKPLGFMIATPLYVFVSAVVMGEREWFKIVAFSIVFTLANWIVFGPLLGIRFPLGPFEHLAMSLGLIS